MIKCIYISPVYSAIALRVEVRARLYWTDWQGDDLTQTITITRELLISVLDLWAASR